MHHLLTGNSNKKIIYICSLNGILIHWTKRPSAEIKTEDISTEPSVVSALPYKMLCGPMAAKIPRPGQLIISSWYQTVLLWLIRASLSPPNQDLSLKMSKWWEWGEVGKLLPRWREKLRDRRTCSPRMVWYLCHYTATCGSIMTWIIHIALLLYCYMWHFSYW